MYLTNNWGGCMNFDRFFSFEISKVEEITKGFSIDKKYVINDSFLVRVINNERVDKFQFVFEVQQKFHKISLCQKALKFIIEDGIGYYITEYLQGENGLDVIGNFSEREQYDFGVLAAKELVRFHKAYPMHDFNAKTYTDEYFNSKVEIARRNNIEKMIPKIEELIKVVRNNLHILYDLKGVLTHSDYHLFNMIFDGDQYMGVIDFERCRAGYCLTDFRNNSPHNSRVSPHFASGYIDGYLNEFHYPNFFEMYNVHDMMMSIAALPWVMEFNPENLDNDIAYINDLFDDVNDITKRPRWYVGKY